MEEEKEKGRKNRTCQRKSYAIKKKNTTKLEICQTTTTTKKRAEQSES